VAAAADPSGLGMCTYCGCRAISLIGRFSAEHESIINAAGVLRRAAGTGDAVTGRAAAHDLAALLDPHTLSEERSLFAELRADPEFAEHVEGLCVEHDEINRWLARVVEGDLADVVGLEKLLRRHIDKEENGLFPAAAVALAGPEWERVVARA
jgi:hemerythrin-like domain-containing protein